jgi:hypothetical protein
VRRGLVTLVGLSTLAATGAGPPVSADQAREPLAVVLVVDVSFSMFQYVEPRSRLEAVTDAFVRALRPGDRAWFGRVAGPPAFSGMFEPASTYVDDQAAVFEVTPAERYGASPLWDALDGAVGRLAGASGRRHIILWTDGRTSGNRVPLSEAVDRAQEAGVAIHILCEPTDDLVPLTPTTAVRVRPSLYLQAAAEVTGGTFLSVQGSGGADVALEDLMATFRPPARVLR